ncbi:MAG TPA: Trp family transcriptional regulator [Patescibacteria group bacterium]|nr:Trp family transcriptional regulator [Patescibacteria group bacterium]
MRVSSQKLNPAVEKDILDILCQVLTDTRDKAEIKQLLKSFLSRAELLCLAKRFAIAKYLNDGLSYAEIKRRLKISSATISQIQEQLAKAPGLRIALEKIMIDEWAEHWAKKIKSLFG